MTDILAELEKPGRDPRPAFSTATFAAGVEKVADLKVGMVLEGVVTNVAAFGAFVDVGVHQDGLVHVSAMSDRFVSDPHEVVRSGQVVRVKVLEVDVDRQRIGLTLRLNDTPQRGSGQAPRSRRRPQSRRCRSRAGRTAKPQPRQELWPSRVEPVRGFDGSGTARRRFRALTASATGRVPTPGLGRGIWGAVAMSAVEGVARTGNGRSLAYAQMGQRDGSPLFYFHGDPGSRLEFDHPLNRPALDGTGVRLIGIDRPGFGGSTRQKQRAYGDWPSDVLAVADHLGLDRFGILAYSAGGPYAVACALAFPDRLSFVGIVSGVGPFETPRGRDGMQRTVMIATRLAGRAPTVLRWVVKRTSPERFSRQFGKELSSVDRALYRQAGAPEAVRDAFAEATRNGPDGLVDDWRLMAVPVRAGLHRG